MRAADAFAAGASQHDDMVVKILSAGIQVSNTRATSNALPISPRS